MIEITITGLIIVLVAYIIYRGIKRRASGNPGCSGCSGCNGSCRGRTAAGKDGR